MRRGSRVMGVGVMLAVAAGLARADGPTPSVGPNDPQPTGRVAPGGPEKQSVTVSQPVQYRTERWEEDYSYLRTAPRTDLWDPVKYVPLGVGDDWYATFGGQFRDRFETFNHNNWGAGPQDQGGYNLARLLLDADFHFGKNIRVFIEGRGAWETGREGGPRTRDRDEADLEQGFVDLILPLAGKDSLTARVGRQELLFGAERLIGPADFSNSRKNHDGVRLTWASGDNQLDAFLTRPVQVQRYDFDNADNKTVFGGVYDTLKLPDLLPGAKSKVEAYGLYVQRKTQTNGNDGGERARRFTAGARFTTNPKPFDVDVEAAYQWGSFGNEDVRAYSIAADVGYTVERCAYKPRLFVDFDIASGDRHPGGRNETFDQQFPSGHAYFGYMDFLGRQNIIDLHPGVEFTIAERKHLIDKMTLRTEYHQFWRQSTTDAIYDTGGNVIRDNTAGSGARNIGSEIDLLFKWQIDRHLSNYVGYSHFFHGSFIQDTGAHKDVDFVYVAMTYTF